jgi:hypothetical protein
MEENVKRLIKNRGIVKGAFTRLENFVKPWEDYTDAGQLEVRLTLLQENWNKFNEIQDELDLLEENVTSDKERTEIENRYCFLLSFIQGKLKDVQSRQINVVPTEPVVQVKLQQLSLPHFNGNISE